MKEFLSKNKVSVASTILASLFAFCLFLLLEKVQLLAAFEVLSILVFVLFRFSYAPSANKDLYIRGSIYHLGISLTLIVYKFAIMGVRITSVFNTFQFKHLLFMGMLLLEIRFLHLSFRGDRFQRNNANTDFNEYIELLPTQVYDYKRISKYLEISAIIGLNSEWGTGKTTIINFLENTESGNYYFININLLSLNIDDLKLTIIEALASLLRQERVYSKSSDQLLTALSKADIFDKLSSVFIKDTNTFEETLKEFKQDINRKLKKPVVIVYEDLDRINDVTKIKSVLDVSNYLCTEKIKVIYQYDETKLLEISDELDYEFLNKYIPCNIELTNMGLRELIEHFIVTTNEQYVTMDDFKVLWQHIDISKGLKRLFSGNNRLDPIQFPVPKAVQIRKVEQFIHEICLLLKSEPSLKPYKDTIILVMYIKHFLHDYFMKFEINTSVLRTIPFYDTRKEEVVSVANLIHSEKEYRQTNNIAENVDNTEYCKSFLEYQDHGQQINALSLCILLAFGYSFNVNKIDYQENITEAFIRNEKALEKNTRIDNAIWCILQAGFSENTDYQQLVDRMDKEVFSQSIVEQDTAFQKLQNDYYQGHVSDKKGVNGVFRLGHEYWQTLFRGFGLAKASEQQWISLLDFITEKNDIKSISVELIEALLYVKITKKTFYRILCFYNRLDVIGNMNNEASYREFLRKYLGAFASVGIMDMPEPDMWRLETEDGDFFKSSANNELLEIKKRIRTVKKNLKKIMEVSNHLDIINAFLDKNLKVINWKARTERSQLRVNISYSGSKTENQEEYERLTAIHENHNRDFIKEAAKSFQSGKITIYELDKIVMNKKSN